MIRINDAEDYSAIVKEDGHLPTQGVYQAMITGVQTREIAPIDESIEFCVVVNFKLVDESTFEVYDFVETFLPYKSNPRVEDFSAFLNHFGYDLLSDDEMIGVKATVEVVYTSLGGYVHPEISFRPWGLAQAIQNCTDETLPF